ncbi:autotransporter domain-containing protein [Thalassospira sp.]|uniref:autotransporter outer membrane beta-barrel domain-containing protein n=1 Tax=Thalassospira sp. TaxID=1912094 RepID=UPI002734C05A|nr:autotransporter domain-containing protein [Thalassospira sp.]MDP2696927.1 autotransporter domain-containing protein [Thalassospira sp.]
MALGFGCLIRGRTLGAFVVTSLFSTVVQAADFTVSEGVTDTVAKTLTAGETGLIEQGGVLNVTTGDAITLNADGVRVTNNGTITTVGGTGRVGIFGSGGGATNVQFVNNGTIRTGANNGYGMASLGARSTFINNGTLTTSGANAHAIHGAGANSTLVNNGTLTTSGNDSYGLNSANANSTIVNSGTITTSGTDSYGIGSTNSGSTLSNSGTITTSGSNAFGMYNDGDGVTSVNSGTITTSGSDGAGIRGDGNNSTLVNSGAITSTNADGIRSSGSSNTLTVSDGGTVTVSGAGRAGIRSTGANGTINVSGTVIATGAATQAIVGSSNQTLNIKPGATIVGTIDLGAGTNAVNIDTSAGARSSTLSISNAGTVNTSASGDGLVLQSGSTVEIVDPTGFAANRAALGTTTVGIHQAVSQQLARSNKPQPVVVVASDLEPGMLYAEQMPFVWGQVFGGYKKRGDDGANLGYRSRVGGAIGGYEKPIGDHSIGVFGGVSVAGMKTDMASVEGDSNGFFVGGYGEYVVGDWAIDGAVVVGYQRHQDERLVVDNLIGEETAQSDYNSVYISPSLAVIRSIDIGGGIELRPSAEVNYTYGYYGEYTETGTTSSNLTVKGHGVDVINGRLQLAARQDIADGLGEIELRGGMKYSYFGRDSVDVGLGSGPVVRYQGTGDTSSYGGYVGVNMRYDVDRRMTVVADMELGLATGDEQSASGYLGLEYRF